MDTQIKSHRCQKTERCRLKRSIKRCGGRGGGWSRISRDSLCRLNAILKRNRVIRDCDGRSIPSFIRPLYRPDHCLQHSGRTAAFCCGVYVIMGTSIIRIPFPQTKRQQLFLFVRQSMFISNSQLITASPCVRLSCNTQRWAFINNFFFGAFVYVLWCFSLSQFRADFCWCWPPVTPSLHTPLFCQFAAVTDCFHSVFHVQQRQWWLNAINCI